MPLKLYNTLTRKRELFKPIKKGQVGIYACGPTVYWYQHIGNMRAFVFGDILKRVLQFDGFKVNHVINVTDVGHLTSDADEGEDKLVKAIKREGLPLTKASMLKLADKYFDEFKSDLKKINVLFPNHWPKATEHIKEMIELIKKNEKNGFTYKTSVGLIFDTSKFKDYTKLGRLNMEQLEQGARTEKDPERRNPADFALWITNQPNHIMLWDSPWGAGFPGWHIECSAMSMKYLGEQFDIHCGGKEHIQIHHTNEIAQSEGATGKKWVNYWLHNEWLTLPKGKMSKSKGSFIRLTDLIEKGYEPLDFRYLCLGTHYRNPLIFSYEALDGARTARKKLVEKVLEFKCENEKGKAGKKYLDAFTAAVNEDLNTTKALAVMWEVVKDETVDRYSLLLKFDEILGLGLKDLKEEKIPAEIKKLAEERLRARNEKDWARSDELREKIRSLGWEIGDTSEGYELKKK